MNPNYQAFSVEIPINDPEKMEDFQEVMDQHHDQLSQHIAKLAQELGINDCDAGSIYLLRTRSRWTQSLEDRLILAFKAGHGSKIHINGEEEDRLEEFGF